MNIENKNISCDVCLDLMPLVHDNVASYDSNTLVYEHIKNCNSCKAEFENSTMICKNSIDDKKIINSIKKNLLLTGLLFTVFGALIGIFLSNSFAMFYNFLIMPIVGGCAYFTLKKKWYLAPIGIFVLSYIWIFIQHIFDGILSSGLKIEVFLAPMFLSSIYTGLTILGVLIAMLLKFALRKEVI